MPTTADICIIGGGPAGSVLGARLAQFGLSVCLVERAKFPRRHLGASLSPGVVPLLASIGAGPAIEAAGFSRVRKVSVHWEEKREREDPDGHGMLVDRGHFDRLLLDYARNCGVRILQPASVRQMQRHAKDWRISVSQGGRMTELQVRFVADASGRAGVLPRRRCRTGPQTLALHAYWKGTGLPQHPRIEAAAERSVRAGLEMVQAVKSMRATKDLAVRIGIATGSVVLGEASRDGKMETGLVLGETPNLAARLQALAASNEVVIALTTQRLLGDTFSLTPMGAHPLKGFTHPVQVWRVDAARQTAGRFEAAHGGIEVAPLVGREEETKLLSSLWQKARSGEGQVVLLGGQPGIGKSRLTQALRDSISEPHASLNSQCSAYHLNSPLHPFVEQFEHAAGFAREDAPERRSRKWKPPPLAARHRLPRLPR